MKYISITHNQDTLDIPVLSFGTGSVGREIPYQEATNLLGIYRYAGGTCIDTGRMYAGGKSEELIGKYLSANCCRQDMILSSKGGFPDTSVNNSFRVTPKELSKDLEQSLKLLQTDYLDIYFLHRDDKRVCFEELMPYLDKLVRSGKVRFIGASNWSHRRISAANQFAKENNLTPFTFSQIQWSLAQSTPEMWNDPTIATMNSDAYEYYRTAGLFVMAYSPLSRGLFSKAIRTGFTRGYQAAYSPFLTQQNILRIARVKELSSMLHATPSQICHAYIYSNALSATAVMGCKNAIHLKDSLDGLKLNLTPAQISYLEGNE